MRAGGRPLRLDLLALRAIRTRRLVWPAGQPGLVWSSCTSERPGFMEPGRHSYRQSGSPQSSEPNASEDCLSSPSERGIAGDVIGIQTGAGGCGPAWRCCAIASTSMIVSAASQVLK